MKRIVIDPDRVVYSTTEYEHVVDLYEDAMSLLDALGDADRDALVERAARRAASDETFLPAVLLRRAELRPEDYEATRDAVLADPIAKAAYDQHEAERAVAQRDAALARAQRAEAELGTINAKCEKISAALAAYELGDSDRNLAGEAEWADVVALRRIEANGLGCDRSVVARPWSRWRVGRRDSVGREICGAGSSLAEALAAYDEANAKEHDK